MPIIEYIGAKPFMTDYVAHSGKVWTGKGSTAEVTDAQANTLLQHPTEFALAKGSAKPVATPKDERTLDKLSAHELREYAKARFGKEIKGKATADLLDQVRELEATVAPVDQSIYIKD